MLMMTPPPCPPPRVGVSKEEWDGIIAGPLNGTVVDELMVVSTARRKDDVNTCAGGWRRWLSSWFPQWLNDIVWGIVKEKDEVSMMLARRRIHYNEKREVRHVTDCFHMDQ
jgi:hypothetical protein